MHQSVLVVLTVCVYKHKINELTCTIIVMIHFIPTVDDFSIPAEVTTFQSEKADLLAADKDDCCDIPKTMI